MGAGLAAGMAGAQMAGSLYGSHKAKKSADAAREMESKFRERALAELMKLNIPEIEAQKIILETPQLVYDYVPQLEQEMQDLSSQMGDIEVDPRLREAQMAALGGLEERAEGGLTPEDAAQIASIRRQTGGQAQAQDASILQSMAQRGMSGSGAELASRLQSGQASAQRASEESDRLAAMNYQAKMAALSQMGNVAGNIRGQEFGEQERVASAADLIAKFNQQNRASMQQRNVGAQNVAGRESAQQKQSHEYARAGLRGQEETHNKGLIADKYQQELNLAKAKASALTGSAQAAREAGVTKAKGQYDMWSGIGKAAGGLIGAIGSSKKKGSGMSDQEIAEGGI